MADGNNPQASRVVGLRRRWPQSLRALDHRNFRLFFAGQLISMIGTWMQTVGAQWLPVDEPDAATLVGLVQTAAMLPTHRSARRRPGDGWPAPARATQPPTEFRFRPLSVADKSTDDQYTSCKVAVNAKNVLDCCRDHRTT